MNEERPGTDLPCLVVVIDTTKNTHFQRPSLLIVEMETADGKSLGTTKQVWSAVEFEAEMDPFDCSSFDFVQVDISLYHGRPSMAGDEHWRFFGAKIAPLSGYHNRFVMIYDRCVRIVADEKSCGCGPGCACSNCPDEPADA